MLEKKTEYRYVNDLRRFAYTQRKLIEQKKTFIFLGKVPHFHKFFSSHFLPTFGRG